MKCFFALLISCMIFTSSFAQLDKGNWLVGGTGNFLSSNYSYTSPTYSSSSKRLDIKTSAELGYFFLQRFSVGLRPTFSKYKEIVDGTGGLTSNENRFEFGPFARYYFLNADKQYNILTDISYQHGFYWFKPTKGNTNTFSASAGPVIYFNSSVGLEFLMGYYSTKEVIHQGGDITTNQKGFQIHLQKE